MNLKDNVWLIAIAALIMGGLVGFALASSGRISAATTDEPEKVAFDTKATTLRMDLNTLLREHAAMGAKTLIDLYDRKDTSSQEELMMNNGDLITEQVNTIYGDESGKKFADLWMKHMDEYKNYTTAVVNGDPAGMDSAKTNLDEIANDLGEILGSDALPAEQITALLNEHIIGTLAIVDAHAARNAAEETTLIKASYDQAGKMADSLAQGIINSHQDIFK